MDPLRSTTLSGRHAKLLACILLACATFVVFSGVLNNDFLGWDDDSYILGNPLITPLSLHNIGRMFSGFYFSSWTPLSLLSHAVDYALWGLDPRGHHLTNLIVHVSNTVWVFLIALHVMMYARRREPGNSPLLSSSPAEPDLPAIGAALFAAVIFSWHPLRVESVACASSRKELLCAFFAFPSVLCYLSGRTAAGNRAVILYFSALILFTLGMLAKPAVMTWPLVLVGFEVLDPLWHGKRPPWNRIAFRALPFILVSAGVSFVAYLASAKPGTPNLLGASPSLLLPAYTFWFYIEKTLYPAGLSVVYAVPTGAAFAVGAAAGVLSAVALAVLAWRGASALGAAAAIFTVTMIPVLGVVPTSIQALANRYTYVAGPAVGIFVGYLFLKGLSLAGRSRPPAARKWLLSGCAIALCAVFVVLSQHEIGMWRDPETMWQNAARVSPDHPVVRLDLGLTLLDRGAYAGAIEQMKNAVALKPDYAEAYSGLGGAYALSGDTLSAEEAFRKSLQLSPGNYIALSRLGNLRTNQRRYREAADLLNAAIARAPGDPFTTLCIADLCYKAGDLRNALRFARAAFAIRPTYGEAYFLAAGIILKDSPRDSAGFACLKTAASLGFAPAIRELESRPSP